MRNKKVYVSLTGGLGNQLFQLSRALAEEKYADIEIVETLGSPRRDAQGKLEIEGFELPQKVSSKGALTNQNHKFSQKVAGYVLRMGVSPRIYEKGLFQKLIILIAERILQIDQRRKFRLEIGKGVGYFIEKGSTRDVLFVGYFQSYVWASKPEVRSALQDIKPITEAKNYNSIVKKASSERPIIAHIRLGDYLSEKDFGILSQNYYENAIRSLWSSGEYGAIWAFSDEPEKAKEFLPLELSSHIYWVPQEDLTSVQVLQLMRLGHAYVIGNSTFSWWGAFLSYQENSPVIAPEPWFLNLADPEKLIPPGWKRLKAR